MRKILEYIQNLIGGATRDTANSHSVKSDPSEALKALERIRALCSQGQYDDALQYATSAYPKHPSDPRIGLEYAALTERVSGYTLALPIWNTLRRLHPQNTLIQYRYLVNLERVDGKANANKTLSRVVGSLTSKTEAHALRTMLEPELGDAGIQALETLVKTDVNSNALHALLLHHISRKNYSAARSALDSKFVSNKTYLELFCFSEEINRNEPTFQSIGNTGENAQKRATAFLKKRVKRPFKIRPRQGFNILALNKITDSSLDTFVQNLVVECSKHMIDREHPISEMALIIGDETKCDKPRLAALKASRVKITNLALYPSTRAPGTFDPSVWIDDALDGFLETFIRDTKAITLRFLDTPPEAIYVWRPELLAQTILAAKAAYLAKPVFICLGDALRPADTYTLGVLAAAIEADAVTIVYDNDITIRRLAVLSDLANNAATHIGSTEFQVLLKGTRKKQPDLLIALDKLYTS